MKTLDEAMPNRRLRQARERHNMTQEDLATELGLAADPEIQVDPVLIYRWEAGRTVPRPRYRRRLCSVLQATPEELGLLPPARRQRRTATIPASAGTAAAPASGHPALIPPLPAAAPLIGRTDLLRHLRRRLFAGGSVVISALSGLPGVGKSSLAIALLNDGDVRQRFGDGVLWAGLGPSADVFGLLSGWGARLGLTPQEMTGLTTVESLRNALQAAIGERRMLLVIDDAWDASAALAFRVGGPDCAHVLTTRFPVVAAAFAPKGATTVRELDDDDAFALLASLAPTVVEREPDEAHALVHAVGGLPLALTVLGRSLQLASDSGQPRRMRTALESLRRAEERLACSVPLSPEENRLRTATGAPLSLQAAIAISDVALPAAARQALRALAVFPPKPNSFSEQAALAVAHTDRATLDTLSGSGLLERSEPGRYSLHQTIADYAGIDADRSGAGTALALYFAAFVDAHVMDFAALDREAANIQAALQAAHTLELEDALVRGAAGFAPYLEARGSYDVAEIYLRRAEAAARTAGDTLGIALAWRHLGHIAELRGAYAQASRIYAEALDLARRLGDAVLTGAILARWGETLANLGNYPKAEALLREALPLVRAHAGSAGAALECEVLRTLGELVDTAGDFAHGDALYIEALVLARRNADGVNSCLCLQNLGAKAAKRGDFPLATAYLLEGVTTARELGHRQRLSALLTNLGAVETWRGRYAEAEAYLREALELARTLGQPVRMGNVLQNLGTLASKRGNFNAAETYLRGAIEVSRGIGHKWLISESLSAWGDACLLAGRVAGAEFAYDEALAVGTEVGANELVALALYGQARVAALQGDQDCARDLGVEAWRRFDREGHFMAEEVDRWLAAPRYG